MRQRHPALALRAVSRLARHLAPSACEQGPLSQRKQAKVSRKVVALADDEPAPVVDDLTLDAAVAFLDVDADARRCCVLLDVGQRLRHLPEDDRLDLVGLVVWK